MFVRNARTDSLYTLVRWGNELYLPVREGDRPEVYIVNGYRGMYAAVPAFLEGLNVYEENGPTQPEYCDSRSMWEVGPGQNIVIKGVHDRQSGKTRPVVIERTGSGVTIAEAVYNDLSLRGQWSFYERWQLGFGKPSSRGWNDLFSVEPHVPSYWDPTPEPYFYGDAVPKTPPVWREWNDETERSPLESFSGPAREFGEVFMGGGTLGGDQERSAKSPGRAGAGLGDAVRQTSVATGIGYDPFSARLALINLEFRSDLAAMLGWGNVPDEQWSWTMPDLRYPWWMNLPWTFDPTYGVASRVPRAPHRPR